MSHDIGESFVHGAGDGATIGRRKTEDFGETLQGATHNEEQFRVAKQLEFEQEAVVRRETYACCITLTHKKKAQPGE
jgi:hypothetical protein